MGVVFFSEKSYLPNQNQRHTPTHTPRLPSGALSGSSCGRSRDEMGWWVEK